MGQHYLGFLRSQALQALKEKQVPQVLQALKEKQVPQVLQALKEKQVPLDPLV
jgi:hypothetical protein